MPFHQEYKTTYTMDSSFGGHTGTTGNIGSTPDTRYSHEMPNHPQSHLNTNSASMSGQRSTHMFSPSTGSRGGNAQQHHYKEYRKHYFEHLNYNIVRQSIEPQDHQGDSEGANAMSDPMTNSLGSNPAMRNASSIEHANIQQQYQQQMDFSQSNYQCRLTIGSIQDKNYELMHDIYSMATTVCSGPPSNFDIARFKTDGVIFITMMNFQAQTFKADLLQKYDSLKITSQQAYQL